MIGMLHARGCVCDPLRCLFTCRYCKLRVGWCRGCLDSAERIVGPICDDCAARIPKHLLEQIEDADRYLLVTPRVRRLWRIVAHALSR